MVVAVAAYAHELRLKVNQLQLSKGLDGRKNTRARENVAA